MLIGAFGAHALQLQPPQSEWFETANRYHFYHALVLLVLPLLPISRRWRISITASWATGVLLFSGSLYLAAADVVQWFWLTPVGGVALLAGWVLLIIGLVSDRLERASH